MAKAKKKAVKVKSKSVSKKKFYIAALAVIAVSIFAVGIGTMTGMAVDGYGTSGYIAKFTTSTNLGNSMIYEDKVNKLIGIGTIQPRSLLSVGGRGYFNTGVSGNGSAIGVYGSGYGFNSKGVHGVGTIGVYGEGSSYDIYAASSNGRSFFSGKVFIGGDVTVNTKMTIGSSSSHISKLDVRGNITLGSGNAVANRLLCWTASKEIGYCSGSVTANTCVCTSIR